MQIRAALAALAMLVMLGSHAPPVETPPPAPPPATFLVFDPVDAPTGGDAAALGRLRWLAGWSVESNDRRVGGISAMAVEGEQVTAFSDAGWLLRFPLPLRSGQARAKVEALPGAPATMNDKADRDVEAMAVHGSLAWVVLERRNLAIRYRRGGWQRDSAARPPAMEGWRANNGAEAMLRLPDGRFLLFSEGKGGISEVLLFLGDPAARGTRAVKMRYRPPEGYRITDAALAPDGRMLLLNRQFSIWKGGFVAKLTRAPVPDEAGTLIEGEEIADLSRPLSDNMEALSVTQEGGRTILWMASDNNYNGIQRTLLLKFALEG